MSHVRRVLKVLALVLLACTLTAAERTWTEAKNTNRPGYDMAKVVMKTGQKDECVAQCKDNPFCRAYTWVEPGVQGPDPVCWLKSAVPDAKPSNCCSSGARVGDQRFEGTFEPNVDLPGHDYRSQTLAVADPKLCQAACGNDENCQAFTYVEPGQQGPDAVCYLKDTVPTRKQDAKCCTSGVKASTLVLFQEHPDTDMKGSDYEDFDVPTGGWKSCHRACAEDAKCRAYTYVKSTDVSTGGHCWLKDAQPKGRSAACCDSGVKLPGDQAMSSRGDLDLPGHDYRSFTPRAANDDGRSDVCRKACGADSKCRAYTYVKPGVQGADAVCWLKDKASEKGKNSDCCASGTRKAAFAGKPVGPGYVPPILYFSKPDPKRMIRGWAVPADMPKPRFPAGYAGCSAAEIEAVEAAWVLAHHHMWRAQQMMQQINASNRRGDLWNHGYVSKMKDSNGVYENWSPRGWFGSYDPKRFYKVRRSIDKVWKERFLGGKVDRTEIKVWCRSDRDVAPCNDARDGAHTGVGTLDVCPFFFSNREDFDNAQFIIHELFHWLKIPNMALWVSDSHDFWRSGCKYRAAQKVYNDDAAYIGMNGGCYDWNYNRAVLTNDNYAWFAATLGTEIYAKRIISFPAENFD